MGPKSNACPDCVPRILTKPSGRHLCHDLKCPTHPGERIRATEYVGKGTTLPRRGWRGEPR